MIELKNYLVEQLKAERIYGAFDSFPKIGDVVLADYPKDLYSYIAIIKDINAESEECLVHFLNAEFDELWLKDASIDPVNFVAGEAIRFYDSASSKASLGLIKEANMQESKVVIDFDGRSKKIDWAKVGVWRR
ncbi:MAG: hypothetical protein EAZ97_05785 [Bacteroidetes bacterium]|nr:MAG: hypothetical protein EAZ97_05785 [Bacteroidota bacterium]